LVLLRYQGISLVAGEDKDVDGGGVIGHADAVRLWTKLTIVEGDDSWQGPAQDPETGQGGPVVRPAANVGPRQEGYQRCGQQQVKELSEIIIQHVNNS